jgi:hypothetical protein
MNVIIVVSQSFSQTPLLSEAGCCSSNKSNASSSFADSPPPPFSRGKAEVFKALTIGKGNISSFCFSVITSILLIACPSRVAAQLCGAAA